MSDCKAHRADDDTHSAECIKLAWDLGPVAWEKTTQPSFGLVQSLLPFPLFGAVSQSRACLEDRSSHLLHPCENWIILALGRWTQEDAWGSL